MIEDSLSFTQQVMGAERLDDTESDEFLSRIPVEYYEDDGQTAADVEGFFRAMSGASQRLLVRGYSLGFLSGDFVSDEMHRFNDYVLGLEWFGRDGYATLAEACEFYDARLSSVLLGWERLGSSLEPLGVSVAKRRQVAEYVLNGHRGFSSAAGLRLSTVGEVETFAALVTYAVVNDRVERELAVGIEDRDAVVALDFSVFPMASRDVGANSTAAHVVHGELEALLRGRSLDDYLLANRFVRERGLGTSSEEARYVMEHLAVESRSMADGFL